MLELHFENIDRQIVYLHFHVKNTINVDVRTVHNMNESVRNPGSEVANKAMDALQKYKT